MTTQGSRVGKFHYKLNEYRGRGADLSVTVTRR